MVRNLRVKVDGVSLQIEDHQRAVDPIIFLHFGGGNLMMWQGVIPFFQDAYRLILVDMRGHGKSDKPPTGYHIDDMARDVIGVMNQLDLERAHVVGSSMGAEVGLSVAANYPNRVGSLICEGALYSEFGPYGIWESTAAEFREYVAGRMEELRGTAEPKFRSVEALVDKSRQTFEKYGWWNGAVEAVERYNACPVGEGMFASSWRHWAKINYMQHYFEYRFEDYYQRITCPILMLPGKYELQDERISAVMNRLCQLAPAAELVSVPEWIHPYGWLLDPNEMCRVVLDFLGRVGDRS